MAVLVTGGATFHGDVPTRREGDIAIDEGVIADLSAGTGATDVDTIDATGCIVLPGFVIAHHHLYSALARGMPGPPSAPTNFVEVLEKVWWRLDRALDGDLNQLSACAGTLEGLLSGVTGIIDHHASPQAIEGSLDRICRGVAEAGGRAVVCYEATDRHGAEGFEAGLAENVRALRGGETAKVRAMVGAHAPFTLTDAQLAELAAAARRHDTYVHIHVAEDAHDQTDARARGHAHVTERLKKAGILDGKSVIAHGVHLSGPELTQLDENEAWLTHQPRSNMNNHVGYLGAARDVERVALGTDGINSDIIAEAQAAYFRLREHDRDGAAETVWSWLAGSWRLLSEVFGLPPEKGFGRLDPGCPADLIVLDYDAPTPVNPGSLPWHLAFGMSARHVRDVIVGGEVVVRNRISTRLDAAPFRDRAHAGAERLWARMAELG